MIKVVFCCKVPEENIDKYIEVAKNLCDQSQNDKGVISYVLHQGTQDKTVFCMMEEWEDMASIDAHNKSPHFTSAVPKMKELGMQTLALDMFTPV